MSADSGLELLMGYHPLAANASADINFARAGAGSSEQRRPCGKGF